MKTFVAIVLIGIFGTVLYGVLDQHGNTERQQREQAEQTLDECWQHAAATGGASVSVCKALADSLKK